MTFAQIGQRLQEKFKQELSEYEGNKALQWDIEINTIPVGTERIPRTCYIERLNISAFEPHPRSTTQLSLGYQINQDIFASPNEAARLGTRVLTERKPAQFAAGWTESLTLGEQGCFHSGTSLIYTVKFDPSRDFPHSEGKSRVNFSDLYPSLVMGDRYFTITDQGKNFSLEAEKVADALSNEEEVLEIFVKRWIKGHS